MAKVTWNDIETGSQSELKKTYKLNDRQIEQQFRKHLDGANTQERRQIYQQFYSRKG